MSVGATQERGKTAETMVRNTARKRAKLLTSVRSRDTHLKITDTREHHGNKEGFVKPANLNEYLHILSETNANDIDLAWILKLRLNNKGSSTFKNKRRSASTLTNPPNVFFKQTKASQSKKVLVDSFNYQGNHADIEHLARHRLTHVPNPSQLTFETGLRSYQSEQKLKKSESTISQKLLSQKKENKKN